MKVAVYSTHHFEEEPLRSANANRHELLFIPEPLNAATAGLAKGAHAVCAFVSDDLGAETLRALSAQGVRYLALRSAGFNHLDVPAAKLLGMKAARVPAYSPNSIAEHAVALMLALNRKIVKANTQTHQLNFSLDKLVGFDMKGKTAGIIGTGKIGSVVAAILHGFGCRLLAYDPIESSELCRTYDVKYTSLGELCRLSDIITLHVPLNKESELMIDKRTIAQMKRGVMLINTGRGKLVDTADVIEGLKSEQIGSFGMDVYTDESMFFIDHSGEILKDDLLARLMTFDNVVITGHQAFLTKEALANIAITTIDNLNCFENNTHNDNRIV